MTDDALVKLIDGILRRLLWEANELAEALRLEWLTVWWDN